MENIKNKESEKELNQEKIIDTIKKVLELSRNNPSENEACPKYSEKLINLC